MGDLLDQPVLEPTTLPAALALVDQLRSELSQLRDQIARLQRDNQCLKQDVGSGRPCVQGHSNASKLPNRNETNSLGKISS